MQYLWLPFLSDFVAAFMHFFPDLEELNSHCLNGAFLSSKICLEQNS